MAHEVDFLEVEKDIEQVPEVVESLTQEQERRRGIIQRLVRLAFDLPPPLLDLNVALVLQKETIQELEDALKEAPEDYDFLVARVRCFAYLSFFCISGIV